VPLLEWCGADPDSISSGDFVIVIVGLLLLLMGGAPSSAVVSFSSEVIAL
jgi:hypothetical protein